jgi:hypothetical protein
MKQLVLYTEAAAPQHPAAFKNEKRLIEITFKIIDCLQERLSLTSSPHIHFLMKFMILKFMLKLVAGCDLSVP